MEKSEREQKIKEFERRIAQLVAGINYAIGKPTVMHVVNGKRLNYSIGLADFLNQVKTLGMQQLDLAKDEDLINEQAIIAIDGRINPDEIYAHAKNLRKVQDELYEFMKGAKIITANEI